MLEESITVFICFSKVNLQFDRKVGVIFNHGTSHYTLLIDAVNRSLVRLKDNKE